MKVSMMATLGHLEDGERWSCSRMCGPVREQTRAGGEEEEEEEEQRERERESQSRW